MATPQLQIEVFADRCRVLEGASKRVFYATPESLGLALLRLAPEQASRGLNVSWMDYLGDRGIAMTVAGESCITLLTFPVAMREVPYRRAGVASLDFSAVFPPLLLATHFKNGRLLKSSLWVIKAGFEKKLGISSVENCLAPFPYGNVYDHGGICWGTTPIKDLRTPAEVLPAFFDSGFNGDLWSPNSVPDARNSLASYVVYLEAKNNVALSLPMDRRYTKSMTALVQDIIRS